jgi:hypothetical protein
MRPDKTSAAPRRRDTDGWQLHVTRHDRLGAKAGIDGKQTVEAAEDQPCTVGHGRDAVRHNVSLYTMDLDEARALSVALQIANCRLQIADCRLRIADWRGAEAGSWKLEAGSYILLHCMNTYTGSPAIRSRKP